MVDRSWQANYQEVLWIDAEEIKWNGYGEHTVVLPKIRSAGVVSLRADNAANIAWYLAVVPVFFLSTNMSAILSTPLNWTFWEILILAMVASPIVVWLLGKHEYVYAVRVRHRWIGHSAIAVLRDREQARVIADIVNKALLAPPQVPVKLLLPPLRVSGGSITSAGVSVNTADVRSAREGVVNNFNPPARLAAMVAILAVAFLAKSLEILPDLKPHLVWAFFYPFLLFWDLTIVGGVQVKTAAGHITIYASSDSILTTQIREDVRSRIVEPNLEAALES